MAVEERIIITTEFRQKNPMGFIEVGKQIKDTIGKVTKLTTTSQSLNMAGKKVGAITTTITGGMKKFRMELLSVMFGAQMLNRAMMGLLTPALETFGIFDLFAAMLQILFIPVVEYMLPVMLKIFDLFADLPEPVKLAIGAFVALVAAVTMIIASAAALTLFKEGIINAFREMGIGIDEAKLKASGFKDFLLKGFAIFLIIEGIAELTKGHILKGLGTLLLGAGIGFIPGPIGVAVGGIGLAMVLISWKAGDKITVFELASTLVAAGIVGSQAAAAFGLPAGVAIGIPIALVLAFYYQKEIMSGFNWLMNKLFPGLWDETRQLLTILAEIKIGSKNVQKAIDTGNMNPYVPKISGGKSTTSSSIMTPYNPNMSVGDFIWRAGQGAVSIDPNDNLIGTKGGTAGGVTINQTNNIMVSDKIEMERMIQENNRKLVDDIRRQVKF